VLYDKQGDVMKKWNRIKYPLIGLAIFAAIMSVFVLILTAISKPANFFNLYKSVLAGLLLFFGGGQIVGILMLLFTNIPDSACNKIGYFFFYAMIACYIVMTKFFEVDDQSLVFIISGVISGLCCYIYWLKELKCQYEK
jgi:peptidoglycan/LPS O-acetylase OafA/YrhL